jgi:DNA gyrase subunit A
MRIMTDLPTREDRLAAALRREHVLVGLTRAQDHLAGVVEAVVSSADTDQALQKVRARLDIDEGQATAVLDVQIRRMSGTERARVPDELHQLRAAIEQLRAEQ